MLAAVLGGGLLLFYLGYTGRLPMRAALSVLLPMAAYLYCALPGLAPPPARPVPPSEPEPAPAAAPPAEARASRPPRRVPAATLASRPPRRVLAATLASRPPRRALVAALALLALGGCAWATASAVAVNAPLIRPMTDEEENYGTLNLNDLDAYALDNPDTLFIYDLSLVSDHRLFPDTSRGIPGNVMFWGGYPARSPHWYRMLAKFGITELNASVFLRDDVLLASTDAQPWDCMMGYVQESTDENVDWSFYDTYGYLYFFQLETY